MRNTKLNSSVIVLIEIKNPDISLIFSVMIHKILP